MINDRHYRHNALRSNGSMMPLASHRIEAHTLHIRAHNFGKYKINEWMDEWAREREYEMDFLILLIKCIYLRKAH